MDEVWRRYRAPCRPFATGCRQCGKAITKGRAYCSAECSDEFEGNHFWTTARWLALRRAKPFGPNPNGGKAYYEAWRGEAVCARCGGPAAAVMQPETTEHGRYYAEILWAPEVNHITPLAGKRSHFGCCHHRENLEVLCHPCHVAVGIEQRALGLQGRPPTKPKRPTVEDRQTQLPLDAGA